ncbi:MAG: Wzt carbohydrate-binding domain-containing protein [Candidatus Omnitrophota bacterium]
MIKIQSISKKYPIVKPEEKKIKEQFKDFWALKDITLEVNKGKILGIIGRNGAGKTTLLNIIAGVLTPTQGEIQLNGKIIGLFNLGVGFHDELTGKENIFLNGAILGALREELENKLNSIIEFSELGNFINMPLGSYSQGMRLRLGFSIIANLDFDILVLDEILAVGDALFQSKCYERLMDFKHSGKTLVITTQSMDLIERLCDNVALFDHGKLLFHGGPAEGINKYRGLLNTEKFFVGPASNNIVLFDNTKKWADDISDFNKKFGTKETIINSVEFINKFGIKTYSIKSHEPLSIKVRFTVRDEIKEPHFGIAIFRDDGVYCYGPNTEFDGYKINKITAGERHFILKYKKILLAPGEYKLSIAVWDKNETIAYDYHNGCYKLTIKGRENNPKELLNIPAKISYAKNSYRRNDNPPEPKKTGTISLKCFNSANKEKNTFLTNEPVRMLVNFSKITLLYQKKLYFWIGIYRDDGIYCQSITHRINNNKNSQIFFPKLALLPGKYNISAGIWDKLNKKFIICQHGIYSFQMVFNKQDHGTVYLAHKWEIK